MLDDPVRVGLSGLLVRAREVAPRDGVVSGRVRARRHGAPPELESTHGFTTVRIVTRAGWVYWYQPAYARVSVR